MLHQRLPAIPSRPRSAFTLIEVLASLLILSLGVLSAIGLVVYGMQLAKESIGRATGMATAMSVAVDRDPLLPPGSTWDVSEGKGFVNGYWVERKESTPSAVGPGVVRSVVDVDVYETGKGRRVCSYSEQLLRRN